MNRAPSRRISSSKRKENTRTPKRTILILCEGETEEAYFKNYRTRKVNVDIIPEKSKYKNPKGIIQQAVKNAKSQELSIKDGKDIVWCVFDLDTMSDNREIKEIYLLADKSNVKIAISNPVFELWFLLHYENASAFPDGTPLLRKLRKHIPNYEKAKCVYKKIKELTPVAIEKCEKLERRHQQLLKEGEYKQCNPYTEVHKLVELLLSYQ